MEEARAWMGLAPVLALLDSHSAARGTSLGLVTPEARLALDEFRGNTRNTDVLAYGQAAAGALVLGVEAKVDEPFDERSLGDVVADPREGSRLPERVDQLCQRLFGRPLRQDQGLDPKLVELPYQLLHGPIAVALEAERAGAAVAVFAVHEIRTDAADDRKHDRNATDWERLWMALDVPPPADGQLSDVPLADPADVTLLAGKAVSDLRGAPAG